MTKKERKRPSNKSRIRKYSIAKREERQIKELNGYNLHHYNPTSRISFEHLKILSASLCEYAGVDEEDLYARLFAVKIVPTEIHAAWHGLFDNLLAWEAIDVIKIWTPEELSTTPALPKKAKIFWDNIFGKDASAEDAIRAIKKEWWPEYPPANNAFWQDKKIIAIVKTIFKFPVKNIGSYRFRNEDFFEDDSNG